MCEDFLFTYLFFYAGRQNLFAQADPHFSQFYAYPFWLNPGLTGVMDGGVSALQVFIAANGAR